MILGVPGTGHSQEQNAGRRILEEQQRRERFEELERAQTGQQITTPKASGVVRETPCFPIDVIKLSGVTILKGAVMDNIVAEFSGKCIGQQSIGNLIQRISAAYADRGYITTRAYIPAQDISTRELKIDVVEGRIEAFVYRQVDKNGSPKEARARKLKFAFPARAGDVLQLRDIEHGLEQINRLASSQANANLSAGEELGTSRVMITEQKVNTVRGTIGIDNRGTKESGRTQIRFGLEADDLLRINDTVAFSYSGSEQGNAFAMSSSVPFRKWLFSGSASYSDSLSNLSSTSDLFTQTASFNLRAERLVFRDARSKYYAYGALSSYWNERFVNISALTPQHRSVYRLGVRQEHRFEKAIIVTDTSLSFGTGFFGADGDPSTPVSGAPRARYKKFEARIDYFRPFKNGDQFSLSFSGQVADRILFSNEQLFIGGWNSVRGYNGFNVAGENGFFARSEYRFKSGLLDIRKWGRPVGGKTWLNPLKNATGGSSAFVFADFGHVYSRATKDKSKMFSVGVGTTLRIGKTTLRGVLAVPLRKEAGQKAGEVQAMMALTVDLF